MFTLVSDQEKLTVTLIDANHCPGAVMFLFQGYFGNILYTGDFRYHENMLDMYPFTNNFVINKLFLDNTYCDPRCEFLNKHEAKDKILKIIYEHSDRDVVIGMFLTNFRYPWRYKLEWSFWFDNLCSYICKRHFPCGHSEVWLLGGGGELGVQA